MKTEEVGLVKHTTIVLLGLMFNFLATPVEEAATSHAGCQNMGTACYGHRAGGSCPPPHLLN